VCAAALCPSIFSRVLSAQSAVLRDGALPALRARAQLAGSLFFSRLVTHQGALRTASNVFSNGQ